MQVTQVTAVSVVSFATVIKSHHATRSLSSGEYMALYDETRHRLRENNGTCGIDALIVSSVWKLCSFSVTNTCGTQSVPSQPTQPKK